MLIIEMSGNETESSGIAWLNNSKRPTTKRLLIVKNHISYSRRHAWLIAICNLTISFNHTIAYSALVSWHAKHDPF